MADYRLDFRVQQIFAVEADRDTAYTAIKAAIDGVGGSPTTTGRGRKWTEGTQSVDETVASGLESEDL